MGESPEHEFLSKAALDIMDDLSRSGLYLYREGSRKRFDFSCDLIRDWSKVISGQTLWKHDRDGIDKDFRILLSEDEVGASVYIARDSVPNRARIHEVADDFRRSPMKDRLARLRVFWVPSDFDADRDQDRHTVYRTLHKEISNDLLMNVALGGLTNRDMQNLIGSGRPGLSLRLLAHIAQYGSSNYTFAAKNLRISRPIAKEEMLRLELSGILQMDHYANGIPYVGDKGRVILDVCALLRKYVYGELAPNSQFSYICRILGVDYEAVDIEMARMRDARMYELALSELGAMLLLCIVTAVEDDHLELPGPRLGISDHLSADPSDVLDPPGYRSESDDA